MQQFLSKSHPKHRRNRTVLHVFIGCLLPESLNKKSCWVGWFFDDTAIRWCSRIDRDKDGRQKKAQFDLRELIILQKLVTAHEAVDAIRKAISLFGGHGVIEDFSALPRLFRDATVNELWEGPRNVLLTRVFRDLQRVAACYPPEEFVANILEGVPKDIVRELSNSLKAFLQNPPLLERDEASVDRAAEWETFCERLFWAYQDQALAEVGAAPIFEEQRLNTPLEGSEGVSTQTEQERQIGGRA
jgi:hypothetical protein